MGEGGGEVLDGFHLLGDRAQPGLVDCIPQVVQLAPAKLALGQVEGELRSTEPLEELVQSLHVAGLIFAVDQDVIQVAVNVLHVPND